MLTLLDVVQKSTQYLEQKGIENPRRQAEEVISEAFGLKRLEIYLNFERPLTESEIVKCRSVIERRGKREPSQYISGNVEFLNCKIQVTRDVLIPRQETEILTDKIIQELSKENLEGKTLWDVCSGSGCIGIAIKKRFPQLHVILSDISEKALEIAKYNAEINEVDVDCLLGDLLAPFANKKADFFVCNPPYIAEHEFSGLEPEVRDFEPKSALVSGPSGLEFYHRLVLELKNYLLPGSKAWLEIGHGQGQALQNLFSALPCKSAEIQTDWSGKERFLLLSCLL